MTHHLNNLGDPANDLALWKMRFDQVQKDRHTAYAEIERLNSELSGLKLRHESATRRLSELTASYMHQRMCQAMKAEDDAMALVAKLEGDLAIERAKYNVLREDHAALKAESGYQMLRGDKAEAELKDAENEVAVLRARCQLLNNYNGPALHVLEELEGWTLAQVDQVFGSATANGDVVLFRQLVNLHAAVRLLVLASNEEEVA